jgi:hypothetical protein
MFTRIALAALLAAGSSSLAFAQGSTNAMPAAPPMKSAPTAGQTAPPPKAPPAAREGEKGLRTGNDAITGDLLEIKRKK